jgi:hypothetical protein
VRFLFSFFSAAFLAACGSSSVAVSSSPLESDEQELASAPIEADGPAPKPGCYCPEVTVQCGKAGAFHARMDRATCTLDLPPNACALFGFETGAKAHPEAILAAAAPGELSADDVFELCTVKHEAHHACDGRMDKPCAFEMDAYDVSLECMSAFATDPKVAHQIEGVRAAREMNACLCAETSCGACAARCKSDHPAFETTCAQAETVYCR